MTSKTFDLSSLRIPPVDTTTLVMRATELAKRSIKGEAKAKGLRLLLAMTDLTTLEGSDGPGRVRSLCAMAKRPLAGRDDLPSCAAVCVYPDLVSEAVAALKDSSVAVAAVATGFPSGRTFLEVKLREVELTVAAGATEIDMVIDRGAFLAGRLQQVFDEIVLVKQACGTAHLKVILETGELKTYDNIQRAVSIALHAGADFVKTSTGKLPQAATLPVVLLMLEAVRNHYLETGRLVGVKAAGGIRTAKDALRYLVLVNETCGDLWLRSSHFRFGASSLAHDILMQIRRLETGRYPRPAEIGRD